MKKTNSNATKINISAAILAGGRARRLNGIAKGNLEIRPHFSIIRHLLNEIEDAGIGEKIIVANDPVPYLSYGVAIIADLERGVGPLAGIAAALHYYQQKCEALLVMPCDMPFIKANEIKILQDAYWSTDAPVVYAYTEGESLHPLCAIVNCTVVNDVDQMLTKGARQVRVVWKAMGAKAVFFEEESAFTNVNSRDDLTTKQKSALKAGIL